MKMRKFTNASTIEIVWVNVDRVRLIKEARYHSGHTDIMFEDSWILTVVEGIDAVHSALVS